MSELAFKVVEAGDVSPGESLSLDRVTQWLLSRAVAQALVEASADRGEPVKVVLEVGGDRVEFATVHVRRVAGGGMPS